MSAVLSDLLPREPDSHAGAALMAGGTALLACRARGKAAGRNRVV